MKLNNVDIFKFNPNLLKTMKTVWKIYDPIKNKHIDKADTWEGATNRRKILESKLNRALFIGAWPEKSIEIEE